MKDAPIEAKVTRRKMRWEKRIDHVSHILAAKIEPISKIAQMSSATRSRSAWVLIMAMTGLLPVPDSRAQEPPALNPFGTGAQQHPQRDDAVPGSLELSDGSIYPGLLFLTRDARLKIFDEAQKRQREIPWKSIKRIDCSVLKEWVEKEWRFKENASDEKLFTGRTYPAREYSHNITLQNNQTIHGSLAGIVYVQADPTEQPRRFLLHKRDKGEPGTDLKALVYVRTIQVGEKALDEGKSRAARGKTRSGSEKGTRSRKAREN
jgi:hypothetical protein